MDNIKYLGVSVTKPVKKCIERTKFPMKENEDDIRRSKDLPCSWIGRVNSENGHLIKQCPPKFQHNFYRPFKSNSQLKIKPRYPQSNPELWEVSPSLTSSLLQSCAGENRMV